MLIGICDDNESDLFKLLNLCELYMGERNLTCQYVKFFSGEEVLEYCENQENQVIQLLFLDVEMSGINGIELKDHIINNNLIYRIAFVTSHRESIYSTFSLKTIGFINKPSLKEDVSKMINILIEDLEKNIVIEYVGYNGERIHIPIENILYFEAGESYTKIVTIEQSGKGNICPLISKKLGQVEKEMKENGFIRVHKSFLVNLSNVIDVGAKVCFRNSEINIPIGRKYKEQVKKHYLLFGKEQIRKRL